MMGGHLLLQVRGLGKRTANGEAWLFREVNLEVGGGDFIWLSGESGSGKSTLLRCLAKLEKPDEGHLQVHPPPSELRPGREQASYYRSQVMYVRQKASLQGPTVEACLAEAFAFRQQAAKRYVAGQAAVWCKRLGFTEALLAKPPAALSGGETQVVALVRALLLEPQGLLLDEPDNALDAKRKEQLWLVLGEWLAAAPRFIVCVNHDPKPPLPCRQVLRLGELAAADRPL